MCGSGEGGQGERSHHNGTDQDTRRYEGHTQGADSTTQSEGTITHMCTLSYNSISGVGTFFTSFDEKIVFYLPRTLTVVHDN